MEAVSRLRMTLAGLVLLSFAVSFTGALIVGLQIDYSSIIPRMLLLAGAFLILAVYCRRMNRTRLLALSETLFGCVFLSTPVLIATYMAMKSNMPLADDLLARMDAAMMFDWKAFIRFIDDRPLLAWTLFISYQSFAAQLLLLPMLLCALRQEDRAYRFVIAFGMLGMVSALVSLWFPALGTYSAYDIEPDGLKSINTHYGYFFLEQFNAVRKDAGFVFSMDRAAGIVTFPSVHAGVAGLCLWAAWYLGWLRYPLLALNIAMATAAISHSNHYFCDIVAGMLLAMLCLGLTSIVRHRATADENNLLMQDQAGPAAAR